jgi:flagellar biosynthesis/type III secretory pathway protein FliH
MTYDPNADRDYWRDQNERRLIEAARDSGHELAIALGERLEQREGDEDMIADLIEQTKELDARCDALRAELQELYAGLNDPLERDV